MFDEINTRPPEFVPAEEIGCDTAKAMTIAGVIILAALLLLWSTS